ncbi:hypothetical protein AVEN_111656-1 [Araneus ventricosus]|uniref:Nucleic-acid-binding protein from transposon X-element n=1 Tax=Araneus ventricosus TaxID=182803 RepID=A0A4Y2C2K4_ARAVE|nr:hypothetical protein AVEN_111656-1 [Araneus ventricosus]
MTAKCVLCAEEHDSRTCPNKRNPEFTPKCANCGGPHTASYRGCPNFPKIKKVSTEKTFASVLKERKQPSTATMKPLNQGIQPPTTSEATDTGLPPSQELANIPLPTEFQINKEADKGSFQINKADLFRFFKNKCNSSLQKFPTSSRRLQKWKKTEDPYNKLFILSEEMNGT